MKTSKSLWLFLGIAGIFCLAYPPFTYAVGGGHGPNQTGHHTRRDYPENPITPPTVTPTTPVTIDPSESTTDPTDPTLTPTTQVETDPTATTIDPTLTPTTPAAIEPGPTTGETVSASDQTTEANPSVTDTVDQGESHP